jgi:hypothetical protein
VVCRTSSATITLAAGTRPLILPGLEARVFRATRSGSAATIVVRVRNTTAVEQTVADVPPRFYLSVPGKQSPALVPNGVPVPIPPGEARTLSLGVALSPGQQRHLDRSGGKADLGVVPFAPPPAGERRLGVVRLALAT